MLESMLTPRSEQIDKRGVRVRVRGKFLFAGGDKLYIRGVTYGTFHPDATGAQFPPRRQVDQDFQQMSASGINAVRVYTPPPFWLLDLALRHGLYVMVGLPWEQHRHARVDRTGAMLSWPFRGVRRGLCDARIVLCDLDLFDGDQTTTKHLAYFGQEVCDPLRRIDHCHDHRKVE